MKKVFCLTGASGVGKSTILEFIKEKYDYAIDVIEVSARPYLPSSGDYVSNLDETSQTLITQHRFADILEGVFKNKNTIYSRSPLDSLAYERVLNKAPFLNSLLQKQLELSKNFVTYIYIPVEFPMDNEEDEVRGNNRQVQLATDKEIKEILTTSSIEYHLLSGSIEERKKQIEEIFRANNIW